jgi:hypothetical protein
MASQFLLIWAKGNHGNEPFARKQLNAAANRGHLLLAWSQAMLWLQKVDFIAKISAKAILYNQPVNLPV